MSFLKEAFEERDEVIRRQNLKIRQIAGEMLIDKQIEVKKKKGVGFELKVESVKVDKFEDFIVVNYTENQDGYRIDKDDEVYVQA